MVKQVPVSFRNHRGLLLRGVVHVPKQYDTAVVLLHGFPANMMGHALRVARVLSSKGFLCLRFDFSGTDTSEGKFLEKRMSDEVKDIRAAIDFVSAAYPTRRLILIGHSTGAIDASLYAYSDKRISGLVLSGAVSNLKHAARYDFSDEHIRDFWTKGYTHLCPVKPRKKKHQWLWRASRGKLKKQFYDEFFTLDIPAAMKRYRRPLLIVHGEHDEAIPSKKDPRELFALSHKPKQLRIIKAADHSYTRPAHQRLALAAIERFIKRVR